MTSNNCRSGAVALVILALAALAGCVSRPPHEPGAAPAPIFAKPQGQNCPAGAPFTDPNIAAELSSFTNGLNQRWPGAAAQKIDPLTNIPPFKSTTSCNTAGQAACGSTIVYPTCEHIVFTAQLDKMAGLSKLSFTPMQDPNSNPKEVAQHTQMGPDASKITDGVYAPEGHSGSDPAYAIVLTHTPNNPGHALVVDLGAVVNVCGNGFDCKNGPQIQADNDDVYQLDYSSDGQNWTKYGQFPNVSGSGLHTRGIATIKSGQNNPSFSTRYLRVFAVSGGNTFSVSELTLYNTGSQLVSIGKPAIGSRPYQITDGIFAAEGHTWNDPTYAAVLRTVGVAHALMIDLGGLVDVCGNSSCGPTVQADRHPFQIDYSPDGINWVPYSQVPEVSGSGLITRTPTQIAAQAKVSDFTARFVRLYGLPADDDNYSISEVQLKSFASGNPVVSNGTPTYGPEPWQIDGKVAPEGADWNDPDYANILSPCGQNTSTVCPKGSHTSLTGALFIDLGQVFGLEGIEFQADNHQFQIDYRSSPTDPWQALWTAPSVSGSGLRTRSIQNLASKQARYLMVYGTAGNDLNYSVSSVKVYTPIAKTPCAYASFADAAQQAAACSYDGTMKTGITGSGSGAVIPTSFTIVSADASYYCTGATGSTHIPVVDGSIIGGTTCTGNLQPPSGPGQFCSATCAASTTPASALTFVGIAADPTNPSELGPAFTLTDLSCNHSTGNLTKAVTELAAGTASTAVGSFLVGLSASPLTTSSGQTLPPLIPSGKCQAP
ncbi:MAG: discoidin domain-containing protein [Nitrospira sp.]